MPFNRNNPYNDLPPLPPKADLENAGILKLLASTSRNLGELKGLCLSLPDPALLINTIYLQESKDSSAIENIVTTQDELYRAATEDDSIGTPEAKEVLNYREALFRGWKLMNERQNLLLTSTMTEIVQVIKGNNAGIRNTPGTALKNAMTGEVIYTPPEGEEVIREKLTGLEQFINDSDRSRLDPIIKMALIHYQFEAIHPFADGNGRTGRILNGLYLVQQSLLLQPVLYLSSYIAQHKSIYYQLLREVTEKENWHDWVMFILTAVNETAQLTTAKIKAVLALKTELEMELKHTLGSSYSYELLKLMFELPYLKIELLANRGMAHRQTATTWLKKLADAGILVTQKKGRNTYYINHKLMNILTNNWV
ncbi:MAG: Fic family protein [Bacteroidetes bacterium]|nr:Fic family protein [Bacteroidota bacterium]